jgi:hypothetical protein
MTESPWLLKKSEVAAEIRKDGLLDGRRLADHLQDKGRLEEALDYVIVQTTRHEGTQCTLGITSEGTFRWFDDAAGLGDMDTASPDATKNEDSFVKAFETRQDDSPAARVPGM